MTDIIWDREAAAHLLRRAGLPGPPDEVEAISQLEREAAVDKLLLFGGIDNSELEAHLEGLDLDLTTYPGILAEWVVRFVHTRRPFEERMALFWHMHFATGIFNSLAITFSHYWHLLTLIWMNQNNYFIMSHYNSSRIKALILYANKILA